jgi:hypothetical protein
VIEIAENDMMLSSIILLMKYFHMGKAQKITMVIVKLRGLSPYFMLEECWSKKNSQRTSTQA